MMGVGWAWDGRGMEGISSAEKEHYGAVRNRDVDLSLARFSALHGSRICRNRKNKLKRQIRHRISHLPHGSSQQATYAG